MQAPTILGCLLVAVICTFKAEGCETDIASSNVEYLRELLLNDTKLFQKQVLSQLPDDAPSLQSLRQMLNDLDSDNPPEFITNNNNNYTLVPNYCGSFSHKPNNQEKAKSTMYAKFGADDGNKTFSLLVFSSGPNVAGDVFLTTGCYNLYTTVLSYMASFIGSVIVNQQVIGDHTGFAKGDIVSNLADKIVWENVNSIVMFNNSNNDNNYPRKISVNGVRGESGFNNTVEFTLLTGGANGTGGPNGTRGIKNEDTVGMNMTDVFNQSNLPCFLATALIGVDAALPN